MSTMRAITLQLDRDEYERLKSEARRLGVPPAALVRRYVRGRLNGLERDMERRCQAGLDALERLAELTADLPAANAVQIARESREELEHRPTL